MKNEQAVRNERERLVVQKEALRRKWAEFKDTGIDSSGLLQWAKCIEAGIEALDWVLAGDDYVCLVY